MSLVDGRALPPRVPSRSPVKSLCHSNYRVRVLPRGTLNSISICVFKVERLLRLLVGRLGPVMCCLPVCLRGSLTLSFFGVEYDASVSNGNAMDLGTIS